MSQSRPSCNEFEIEITLTHNSKIIDGFDTSERKLGEFEDLPRFIDGFVDLYNVAEIESKTIVGYRQISVQYAVVSSESPQCLYPVNQRISKYVLAVNRTVSQQDFGPGRNRIRMKLLPIDLKQDRDSMAAIAKIPLFVNEIRFRVLIQDKSAKTDCSIEYVRQLCTQRPISKVAGF
ncbi:MAG: hypothetical protein JST46_15005 [Bacteroidetes bacterium]|nr:hypothetical protein [Bacteroidota bacterium]